MQVIHFTVGATDALIEPRVHAAREYFALESERGEILIPKIASSSQVPQ